MVLIQLLWSGKGILFRNPKFFNFFPFGSKKISSGWIKDGSAHLIYNGSKVSLDWVGTGQGQGPSLEWIHLLLGETEGLKQLSREMWKDLIVLEYLHWFEFEKEHPSWKVRHKFDKNCAIDKYFRTHKKIVQLWHENPYLLLS